jgi:hypothetical protein
MNEETLKKATLEALEENVDFLSSKIEAIADNTQDQLNRISDRLWGKKDIEDNRFWMGVWGYITLSFIVFVSAIAGCSIVEKQKIAEMVAKGENPIAARCSFAAERDTAICITYLHTVKK